MQANSSKLSSRGLKYTRHMSVFCAAVAFSTTALARGPDLPVEFLGGSLTLEGSLSGYDTQNPDADKPSFNRDVGQSVFLDFGINALGFAGEARVNHFHQAIESEFKFRYGDRINTGAGDKTELYSLLLSRLGDEGDFHIFHHVPRYHWGYEGDYFGLLREATDLDDFDVFNNKSPSGIEFVGKGVLDGLKIVGGKEIYWGADPQVIAKYRFGSSNQYSILWNSDVSDQVNRRKISAQGEFDLSDSTVLKLGVLNSGSERTDETYQYHEGTLVYENEVGSRNAYAIKLRVEESLLGDSLFYSEVNYAGLVADGGEHQEIWDTELPYSEQGNKKTVEIGGRFYQGPLMVRPRIFMRRNLVEAMSTEVQDGGFKRHLENSPFAVLSNRAVDSAELFFTYDPTPNTFFYEWDNFMREDAKYAFNIGLTYSDFKGKSDARVWETYQDVGRLPERVFLATSRFVLNPHPSIRISTEAASGQQQPIESSIGISSFSSFETRVVYRGNHVFNINYAADKYGEYDYYRDYGVTYPQQIELGYERLLDGDYAGSKYGIRGFRRTLDAGSGAEYLGGVNDHMYEVQVFFTYGF